MSQRARVALLAVGVAVLVVSCVDLWPSGPFENGRIEMQVWWRNYYCSIGKCVNAAVPGASKHGLGRAIDFEDRLGELTFESPGYAWLTTHAAEFGFFHPPSVAKGTPGEEAWHREAQVTAT